MMSFINCYKNRKFKQGSPVTVQVAQKIPTRLKKLQHNYFYYSGRFSGLVW